MHTWSAFEKYPSGDLARLAQLANIDGKILVYGRDEISPDGRRQFQVAAVVKGLGQPKVLVLDRDRFPPALESSDSARAKYIEMRFQARVADGELEVLKEAWIDQGGTPTERMEQAARLKRQQQEARERAAKLINERKNRNGKR